MNDVPNEVKIFIIEQSKQKWRNTIYDAGLDIRVAEIIGDEKIKADAAERIKRALRAIDALEQIARELQEEPNAIKDRYSDPVG